LKFALIAAEEYIDYHLSPSSTTTSPPDLPRFVRIRGPSPGPLPAAGEGQTPEVVVAQLGSTATLTCLVANLRGKTVSANQSEWAEKGATTPP